MGHKNILSKLAEKIAVKFKCLCNWKKWHDRLLSGYHSQYLHDLPERKSTGAPNRSPTTLTKPDTNELTILPIESTSVAT